MCIVSLLTLYNNLSIYEYLDIKQYKTDPVEYYNVSLHQN